MRLAAWELLRMDVAAMLLDSRVNGDTDERTAADVITVIRERVLREIESTVREHLSLWHHHTPKRKH